MRAMVTGAGANGIGGATCIRLARDARLRGESARIAVCATGKRKELSKLLEQIQAEGAETVLLTGDLCDPTVPPRLVEQAVEFCGGLDALVSNAGFAKPSPLLQTTLEDWDQQVDLHARAAWLLAKAAHPALKESRGAIVATASMAGTVAYYHNGVYPIAKAALIMLCKMLAQEWAVDGIRVNVVSPGPIRTRLTARYYANPDVEASRKAVIPLGRIGEPEDVAGVIAFLLGADAGFITGENILIDGGLVGSTLNQVARSVTSAQ